MSSFFEGVRKLGNTIISKVASFRLEFGMVAIGQFVAFLGGFLGMKTLTNCLSPEDYGRLALGITIAGILFNIIYGPLSWIALRFYPAYRDKGCLSEYFLVVRNLYSQAVYLVGFLLTPVICLAAWQFSWGWAWLILIAAIFSISSGYSGLFMNIQVAIRQRKIVAFHQVLDAWLRPAFAVLLVYGIQNTGNWAFLGYSMAVLLVAASQYHFCLRNSEIRDHWQNPVAEFSQIQKTRKEFMEYAIPVAWFGLIATVTGFGDKWIVQGLLGAREVGIYAALFQIANAPIALLIGAFSQFISPILFERAGTMKTSVQAARAGRLLWQAVLCAVIAMAGILVVSYRFEEPLIRFFTNATFLEHRNLLWILVLGIGLYQVGQFLTFKGFYYNQTRLYIIPRLIHSVSFVIFALWFGRIYGVLGIGYAQCACSLCYAVAIYWWNRKMQFQPDSEPLPGEIPGK